MNVKLMLAGFLIAVIASMGTYFLVPPPSGASAKENCATFEDTQHTNELIIETSKIASGQIADNWKYVHSSKGFVLGLREALIDAGVISNKAKLFVHEVDATHNIRG